MYVALTQTASTLPFFLFALPLGSVGDIVDRRKLILYTETWMVCAAIALAVMLGITVYGEFRSISKLIERVPLLRQLDSAGRPTHA